MGLIVWWELGFSQYDGLGEYCDSHTASSVFLGYLCLPHAISVQAQPCSITAHFTILLPSRLKPLSVWEGCPQISPDISVTGPY